MASNLVRLMVVGRVGRDPEMRYTPSGTPVTNFSVAATRRWSSADGNPQGKTTWFRVTCWRKLAETTAQYLKKGRLVAVEAQEIQASAWNKDGKPKASIEVTASAVHFLDKNGDSAQNNSEEDDLPL